MDHRHARRIEMDELDYDGKLRDQDPLEGKGIAYLKVCPNSSVHGGMVSKIRSANNAAEYLRTA